MRILLISNNFTPGKMGGADKVVLQLAQRLVLRGHRVEVLTYGKKPFLLDGIRVNTTPFPKDEPRVFGLSLRSFPYLFNIKRLISLCWKLKQFDIIHIHNTHSYEFTFYLMLATKLLGKKTIWTPHDCWFLCPKGSLLRNDGSICTSYDCENSCYKHMSLAKKANFKRVKLNRILKKVDKVVSLSYAMREKLIDFGIDEKKIEVIYNGIDIESEKQPQQFFYNKFLYVGYIGEHKGCEYLIKAIPLVKKFIPNIELNIVGDGIDKERLMKMVGQLGVSKNINFVGWIQPTHVKNFYQRSNLLVLPSIGFENCSIVILESFAHGKPVITTNIGGNPELVENGVSGFVVEPKNSDQIAERIIQLLSNKKLAKRLGENARKRAEEKFGIEAHVTKIEKVYKELVEKNL